MRSRTPRGREPSLILPGEPAGDGFRDQIGGILLDEMAGAGIVTSVKSLSTQFQVSLSAPGSRACVFQAVDQAARST